MSTLDELAGSYTYSGVFSLKAVEDDIVTLENEIERYGDLLKEAGQWGMRANTSPLEEKLRDAKARLGLLKTLKRREIEKGAGKEDEILSILDISAKDASEIESPSTAADGRQPKPQDFKAAGVEALAKEFESEVEVIENEPFSNEEIIRPESEGAETASSVFEVHEDDDVKIVPSDNTGNNLREVFNNLVDDDSIVVRDLGISPEPEQIEAEFVNSQPSAEAMEVPEDNDVPFTESIPVTQDPDITPPPTIDDYFEPEETVETEPLYSSEDISVIAPENILDGATGYSVVLSASVQNPEFQSGPLYDKPIENEGFVYDYANEPDLPEIQTGVVKDTTVYDGYGEVIISEDDQRVYPDVRAYNAFEDEVPGISASFNLGDYTGLPNTDSVRGAYDGERRMIHVTFTDMRDYGVLLKLSKERHEKWRLFKQIFKKPKSIFMDVRERNGNKERCHRFEFMGCRLKRLYDSEYVPAGRSRENHEFTALFKYKRLKIE